MVHALVHYMYYCMYICYCFMHLSYYNKLTIYTAKHSIRSNTVYKFTEMEQNHDTKPASFFKSHDQGM